MEFNIQRIIEEMQDFQKEMHNEFKDSKTFWKHFYKKLDKEIYKEFKRFIKQEDKELNKPEKQENPKKEVLDFIKKLAQKIGVDEIEIIEISEE